MGGAKAFLLWAGWIVGAVFEYPVHAEPMLVPYSSITITFREMGVAIDAPFTKFDADIDFDPARPLSGRVHFTIDIGSLDLGNPEYTKAVLKPEWFDVAQFPTATFVSTRVRMISPSELEASGKITIKGQTEDITFPVSVRHIGNQFSYDAVVHVDRNHFGVGTGEWLSTELVADDVAIKVHAARAPSEGSASPHGPQ